MTGHNMRTAKLSDLDTVAQFKLTVSNIGDVKCAKLSDEELAGDPESSSAQRLLHSLSVSGPCDLDADKLKELLAIALRKTEAVHQFKVAGAVDVSAEDGAADQIPARSSNQEPAEVEVQVPEFPDRNENEPIGGDLIPPAGGEVPATRFATGESGNESKAPRTVGRPVGSARKDKNNMAQFEEFKNLLFKPVVKGQVLWGDMASSYTTESMRNYVESALTVSTSTDDTQKKKLHAGEEMFKFLSDHASTENYEVDGKLIRLNPAQSLHSPSGAGPMLGRLVAGAGAGSEPASEPEPLPAAGRAAPEHCCRGGRSSGYWVPALKFQFFLRP